MQYAEVQRTYVNTLTIVCSALINEDAERIKEGVRTRNGKMVWAGAECKVPAVPVNLQSVSNEVIE